MHTYIHIWNCLEVCNSLDVLEFLSTPKSLCLSGKTEGFRIWPNVDHALLENGSRFPLGIVRYLCPFWGLSSVLWVSSGIWDNWSVQDSGIRCRGEVPMQCTLWYMSWTRSHLHSLRWPHCFLFWRPCSTNLSFPHLRKQEELNEAHL